jgi:hypothetical protein
MSSPLSNNDLKALGKKLIDFKDEQIKDLELWISHFPDSGRSPKGQKDNFETIKNLKKWVEFHDKYKVIPQPVKPTMNRFSDTDIDALVDTFLSPKKQRVISAVSHHQFSFINKSALSQKAFLGKVKDVIPLLDSLKGFHLKAVETPLEIHFKKPSDINSKAKYKRGLDQVWVNSQSLSDNDLYGHLKYIIVHELGHRHEALHGLPEDYSDDKFYTTRYSHVESFSSSEAFAEVFAVSNWPEMYPEHKDEITRFNQLMSPKKELSSDHEFTM